MEHDNTTRFSLVQIAGWGFFFFMQMIRANSLLSLLVPWPLPASQIHSIQLLPISEQAGLILRSYDITEGTPLP